MHRLAALNRWHKRNHVAGTNYVISLDPFCSRGQQEILVPDSQAWRLVEELLEQNPNRRSRVQFDRFRPA
jgi:hypothetical protein